MRAILVVVILLACQTAWAYTEADAVRACVGEAAGEPYAGKVAVLEAIRNRGHLRGVYGVRAAHIASEPKSTWTACQKAYKASLSSNVTHGATHWEGTAFPTPPWAKAMIKTVTIGNQAFYKERG